MFVYASLILLITIWYLLVKRYSKANERLFMIGIFFILFTVCSLRSFSVGTDTQSYVNKFMEIGSRDWEYALNGSYYEFGYALINKFFYLLAPYERTIVVFNSFFINLGICLFIYRYSSDKFLSVFVYITLLAYTISMNASRQYVAIAIICMGYKYIVERRFVLYALVVLLASSIHASAILCIVLYWIYSIRFTIKRLMVTTAASIIAFFSLSLMLRIIAYIPGFERYIKYLSYTAGGRGRTFLVSTIILVMGLLVFKEKKERQVVERNCKPIKVVFGAEECYLRKKRVETSGSLYNLMFWQLVLSTIFYLFTIRVYVLIRAAEMFAIGNLLFFPLILDNIESTKTKKTFTIVTYVFLICHFILSIMFTAMQRTIPFTFL